MHSIKVNFTNKENISLFGQIDYPVVRRPKAYAIFAHCFTCSSSLKAVDSISQALTSLDFAVLRFDFTGLGRSKGEFEESNFSSNLDDLVAAYQFLKENYETPQVLIGHSLGGAAVLHVAGRLSAIKAVATIGAPSSPVHVRNLLKEGEVELQAKGEATISIGGRPFKIKKQLLEDLDQNHCVDSVRQLNKALLIMHSPQDQIVGIDNAAEIYQHANHPKSFITLDGSDHLLSQKENATYAGLMVASWAIRYIDVNQQSEIAAEGEVVVRNSTEKYRTEVITGQHHYIADEPEEVGGEDLGPSPYGFLLAALGSCTAMTLRMYANHKKLDLKSVRIHLTHDKVHCEDCENSEGSGAKIDQIKRMISLEGELTESERKRLIEIADRCPVHKTLEGKPQIFTEEV